MSVQKLTAQIAILGVLHLFALNGVGSATPRQADTRQRVGQFGVGTDVKIKLKNGEKLRGSVASIGDDGFVLMSKDGDASREIAFGDVGTVNYPRRGYKANGAPDPVAAKRMVVQLGVGEHIMVQTGPAEKVRGHIREIHDDHFVIMPDGQTTAREVPYDAIQKVNKNLSFGATIVILAAIATAAVLILVLSGKDDIDVLPN